MPETIDHQDTKALPPPRDRKRLVRGSIGGAALVAVLAAGAALGAGGTRIYEKWQPRSVMLLQPAAIDTMKDSTAVAIKGEVAEVFGNKFIVQDATARALVDTGPRGERRPVAAKGETLTVQGRFDRGVVRADVIVHADGRNEAFGPPHDGPKGPKDGPRGPKDGPKDGPRAERDAPPPPPADRPEKID